MIKSNVMVERQLICRMGYRQRKNKVAMHTSASVAAARAAVPVSLPAATAAAPSGGRRTGAMGGRPAAPRRIRTRARAAPSSSSRPTGTTSTEKKTKETTHNNSNNNNNNNANDNNDNNNNDAFDAASPPLLRARVAVEDIPLAASDVFNEIADLRRCTSWDPGALRVEVIGRGDGGGEGGKRGGEGGEGDEEEGKEGGEGLLLEEELERRYAFYPVGISARVEVRAASLLPRVAGKPSWVTLTLTRCYCRRDDDGGGDGDARGRGPPRNATDAVVDMVIERVISPLVQHN